MINLLAPRGLHKLWDTPCFLHSDSDQQKDNINHTQPLTSSNKTLSTTHGSPCVIICGIQGKFACHLSFILLKLASKGSIPWDTVQSQDRLNLGDICFCPTQQTPSLDCLLRLIAESAFMPPALEGTLKLSGTTTILLISQVDDQLEKITDVYVGLMVHRIESHLYAPDQILDFVSNIEVNLKAACNALKVGGDPGKRHAFCLFVNNYGGTMSVPTDPPYCLIYPMRYVKGVEPDHFDTCNNPAGTCLHCCICHATLQHMNDDSCHCREYGGSHLILPCGA